jgi:hypothetical protein
MQTSVLWFSMGQRSGCLISGKCPPTSVAHTTELQRSVASAVPVLLLLLPGLLMTSLVTLLEHPSEVSACSNFQQHYQALH